MSRAFVNEDVAPVGTPQPTNQQDAERRQQEIHAESLRMFEAQDKRVAERIAANKARAKIAAALASLR